MFQPLAVCIGLRYTRARQRAHFVSFISLMSILGTALGVMALITVLSVMNGFERELRSRILGLVSHATISGIDNTLADWQDRAALAKRHRRVVAVAPFVRAEAMISAGRVVKGILVRGIDPALERAVSDLDSFMLPGASVNHLVPGRYRIALGNTLAEKLGVGVGDKVTVLVPQARVTPAGLLPRMRRFEVVGLFSAGHGQYDDSLALVHMDDAARLFRLGDRVSGIRLKVDDVFAAPLVAREAALEFAGRFYVRDWTQYHANFFRALGSQKLGLFMILALIVAVAAFNVVSTLIMVVTDKRTEIAVLRTLGMTPSRVMAVFMVQGVVIGVVGTGLGVAGGLALALNVETLVPAIEGYFGVKFIDASVYFISSVPSDLRWSDVTQVSAVAFALSALATLYPAWRASRVDPAQALRHD